MDLSKASMYDLHYLNDVQANGINNCTLIDDAEYLSSEKQTDLFSSSNVILKRQNVQTKKTLSLLNQFIESQEKEHKLFFLNYAIK